MLRRARILMTFVALALVTSTAYTNCGMVKSSHTEDSSAAKSAIISACESTLKQQFNNSYRPFLMQSNLCMSCHSDSGVSPIKFASNDLNVGFSAFMGVGPDAVDRNALSATHAAGVTGPALQSNLTSVHLTWDPAFHDYQDCLAGASTTTGAADALTMVDKKSPTLYFTDKRTVSLTWDLNSSDALPFAARIPALFLVDAKVDYNTAGVAIGYMFTNPRIQMTTGESEVEIEGVVMRINGQKASQSEPFLSARKISRGIDPSLLFNGSIHVPLNAVSSADNISVGLGFVNLRARTDNPPIPPNPTLSVTNAYIRAVQIAVSPGGDSTARRWCLTTSAAKPASTAVPCPGFENNALSTGWLSVRPTTFKLTDAGLVPTTGQVIPLYLWVANSDLKINTQAATTSVTFDLTAPNAPAYNSVTLGATQIADLSLGNSNETVQWCVAESAIQADVTNINVCNGVGFTNTKPSFIGLKGGGTRYVAVFVRDLAGNTASAGNKTVVNSYGQITFTKLIGTGAQAIITNRCASCHNGANVAANAKWDSTSFTSTVAKKTLILQRIVSSTSPMPPTGLIPAAEQALLQLWLTQTTNPVQ